MQGWQKTGFFRNKPKKTDFSFKPFFFGFYVFYVFFSVCIFLFERTNLCFIIPHVLFPKYELNNGFRANKFLKCDKKAE